MPGLYDVKWYNGQPFSYKEGFIRNREALMVGMPRLRQKRLKKGKCLIQLFKLCSVLEVSNLIDSAVNSGWRSPDQSQG